MHRYHMPDLDCLSDSHASQWTTSRILGSTLHAQSDTLLTNAETHLHIDWYRVSGPVQSTAAPMLTAMAAKDTANSLCRGLPSLYAANPTKDRTCRVVRPDLVRHHLAKGGIPRKIGETEERSESSWPAMPSSQTEK